MLDWEQLTRVAAAIAALVVIGRFLDSYHNRSRVLNQLTNATRSALVRAYIFLEDHSIPDIAASILSFVLRHKIVYIFVSAALSTSIWYVFLRGVEGLTNIDLKGERFYLAWSFLVAVSLAPQILLILLLQGLQRTRSKAVRLLLFVLSFIVLTTPGWGFGVIAFGNLLNTIGHYIPWLILFTFSVAALNSYVLFFLFAVFSIFRITLVAFTFFAKKIFDAASDPKISPFTYFSGLSAVVVVIFNGLVIVIAYFSDHS